MEEKITYCARKLEFVIQLFKEHQSNLLSDNREKIIALIGEYQRFVGHPNYNPLLPSTIETFIL